MKINVTFEAQVLSSKVQEGLKDPSKKYHYVTLFIPSTGEAGQLYVSETVFNNIFIGNSYVFSAEYDDNRQSFRILSTDEIIKGKK